MKKFILLLALCALSFGQVVNLPSPGSLLFASGNDTIFGKTSDSTLTSTPFNLSPFEKIVTQFEMYSLTGDSVGDVDVYFQHRLDLDYTVHEDSLTDTEYHLFRMDSTKIADTVNVLIELTAEGWWIPLGEGRFICRGGNTMDSVFVKNRTQGRKP